MGAMAPVQDLIEALQEDDSAQQEQAEMAAAKAKKSDEVGKLGEDEGEVPWWKKQWAKYDADDKKFDFKGGKLCRKNYFVAGLFRSHCNSLYCLEMAKCCQVQRSVWNECKWVDIQGAFSDQNC